MTKKSTPTQSASRFTSRKTEGLPMVRWDDGVTVTGYYRAVQERTGDWGPYQVATIELTEPLHLPAVGDFPARQLVKGDRVLVPVKAGLSGLLEESIGTEVQISCLGQVKTKNGRTAYKFDLAVAQDSVPF